MSYTFDENIISDLHKDARGYRPSQGWWDIWETLSDDAKQETWDSLCTELESEMDRERKMQEQNLAELKQRIQETIKLGAGDEVTALKWIMEAEGFEEYDYLYGASYFCYHFGLSYQIEKEMPFISQAMKEMLPIAA